MIDLLNYGKVFIIAELSANHNGSLEIAIETIRAAKRTGADAVKLQTYTPDTITLDSNKDDFKINHGTIWDGQNLYELYKQAHTPWEWHEELFRVAKEEELFCFSSPFDFSAVEFLESLDTPAYKVASAEITDIPLIELIASKGKPVILSTGIATNEDIELAINACRKNNNNQIALLKCTSSYPSPIDEANIIMVKDFGKRYGVVSGLSDHTMGITVPIVATCYGAKIIEKHFIMDKEIGGPDSSFSLDEKEFTKMVKAVREAEKAIGVIDYSLSKKQQKSREFSRSLYVVKNIKSGEFLSTENVRSIRPGYGMHPKYYSQILGKVASRNIEKGTALKWEHISE